MGVESKNLSPLLVVWVLTTPLMTFFLSAWTEDLGDPTFPVGLIGTTSGSFLNFTYFAFMLKTKRIKKSLPWRFRSFAVVVVASGTFEKRNFGVVSLGSTGGAHLSAY